MITMQKFLGFQGSISKHQFYYHSFLEEQLKLLPMSLMEKYSTIYKLVPNHSSVNFSSSFRNSGRKQLHAFGARYQRPMHDLDYTKPILQHSPPKKELTKSHSKHSIKNPQKTSQFRIKSITRSDSKPKQSSPAQGIKATNYFIRSNSTQRIQLQSRQDEMVRNMQMTSSLMNKSSPSLKAKIQLKGNTFGLSECELQKTIMGKIAKKSSHHIDFGKTVDRPENVNRIWYNKDQTYSPVDREKDRNLKDKIHYFKSGSGHKAFQVGTPFDKNYDAPVWIIKKRSDINIRSLDKMKARPGLEIKLGTNLDYEKDRSLQNKKRPIFQIAQTQRKIIFSRQVISPKKGAYR